MKPAGQVAVVILISFAAFLIIPKACKTMNSPDFRYNYEQEQEDRSQGAPVR